MQRGLVYFSTKIQFVGNAMKDIRWQVYVV